MATVINNQFEITVPPLPIQITTEKDGTKKGELEIKEDTAQKIIDSLKKQGKDTATVTIPDPKDELSSLTASIPTRAIDKFVKARINLELKTQDGGVTIPQQTIADFQKRMGRDLYFQFTPVRDELTKAEIFARATQQQQQQLAAMNAMARNQLLALTNYDIKVIGRSIDIASNIPPGERVAVSLPIAYNPPNSPALEAEILDNYKAYIEHSNGEKVFQKFDKIIFQGARPPIGTVNVDHLINFTIIKLSDGKTDVGSWQNDEQGWKYIRNGQPATGWNQIGGSWYLMDSNGIMQTGWHEVNGRWYLLNDDGSMVIGWQQSNGEWYYLYSDGSMASDTVIHGYPLDSSGAWIQ